MDTNSFRLKEAWLANENESKYLLDLLYDWGESITRCPPSYVEVVSCPHLCQNCVFWFLFQKLLWHLNSIEAEVIEAFGSSAFPQHLRHLHWLQLHLTEVDWSNGGNSGGEDSGVGGCEVAPNQNKIVNLPCVKHWEKEGTPLPVVHPAFCQVQNWDLENLLSMLFSKAIWSFSCSTCARPGPRMFGWTFGNEKFLKASVFSTEPRHSKSLS